MSEPVAVLLVCVGVVAGVALLFAMLLWLDELRAVYGERPPEGGRHE